MHAPGSTATVATNRRFIDIVAVGAHPRRAALLAWGVVLAVAVLCASPHPAQATFLDRSFGSSGVVSMGVGGDDFDPANLADVVAVPQGLVAVGQNVVYDVVRWSPDGSVQGSFRRDSTALDPRTGELLDSYAPSAAVGLPSGGLITGGDSSGGFTLVKHDPTGRLDPTFGSNGIATTNVGATSRLSALAAVGDGRLVAGGYAGQPARFAVARYNADGTPDGTFGSDGVVTLEPLGPGSAGEVRALLPAANGGLIVVGTAVGKDTQATVVAVAHLDSAGLLDPSFAGGHRVLTFRFGRGREASAAGAAWQTVNGLTRLVVAGTDGDLSSSSERFAPRRRTTALAGVRLDGTLDRTFGTDGIARVDFGDHATARRVAVVRSGAIVLAGGDDHGYATVARFTPTGELDRSFGGGRICLGADVGHPERDPSTGPVTGLALQSGGRIVIGMTPELGASDVEWRLARFRMRFTRPTLQCAGIPVGQDENGTPRQFSRRGGGWVTAVLGRRSRLVLRVDHTFEIGPDRRLGTVNLGWRGPGVVAVRWNGRVRGKMLPRGDGFVVATVLAVDGRRRVIARSASQLVYCGDCTPPG